MKMSPASRNWEYHIRCLAAAIILRGPNHAYSKINFHLLASSRLLLMLQTLSAREPNDWQERLPIRSAWLGEIKLALGEAENPKFSTDYELYRSVDSLMIEVTTVVSTMAQFDQLLAQRSTAPGLNTKGSNQILIDLYDTAEDILSRTEVRLARWNTNICEISFSSWLSLYHDMATNPISGLFWSNINEGEFRSYLDSVLTFRNMLEYHSVTMYWTIIMSLRLLLSDMLTLMVWTNVDGMPANSPQRIEDHRIKLMKYALNVLQTICYATHMENREVAPFVFATAFQLTVAVLERECKSLREAAGNHENRVMRCEGLKSLAVRYLDWAVQNKIPVTIDLDSLRKWEFASIA
ncbi:hypothetical protein BU16DRAFT_30061 [Lophium mytilinum]|uniref:Transcription factor domain-containing protein n=1 Tax=Lophium mytilinum TaxID=390894 RepID=A0A6A6RF81_9PEZI|nr:hypothetical protein BU16DRAFT_30061 [Lophium mytilinum]